MRGSKNKSESNSKVPTNQNFVSKNENTISHSEFKTAVAVAGGGWDSFYSEKPSDIIPCWYEAYKSQFPYPNDVDGILQNCVRVLLLDQESDEWLCGGYQIPVFGDTEDGKSIKALQNPKQKWDTLMKENKSPLQQFLMAGQAPDNWCPEQCALPYEAFRAHILWFVAKEGLQTTPWVLRTLDSGIFKLRYAQYLALRTSGDDNHQFLFGVFSAYGPDLRKYPTRIYELLVERGLLRGKLKTPSVNPYSDMFFEHTGMKIPEELQTRPSTIRPNSGCSNSNAQEDIPDACTKKDSPIRDGNVSISLDISMASTYLSPCNSNQLPITREEETNFAVSTVQNLSASVSPHTTSTRSNTRDERKEKTISRAEFSNGVRDYWIHFYGPSDKQIPDGWYDDFVRECVINGDEILHTCMVQLIQDELNWCNSSYTILYPKDSFSPDEFYKVLKSFDPAEKNIRTDQLMRSEKSYLQQSINSLDTNSDLIPRPGDWAPSRCSFPFQAFSAYTRWYFQRDGKRNLEVEVPLLRLRYVEYLSVSLPKNTHQFLRGILIAYGPNVLNYPIRILQIMNKHHLLKPSSHLYKIMCKNSSTKFECTYVEVFDKVDLQNPQKTSRSVPPIMALPVPDPMPQQEKLIAVIPAEELNTETIPQKEFFQVVRDYWIQFYGTMDKAIPSDWYNDYKTRFQNCHKDGQFDACVRKIVQDQHNGCTATGLTGPGDISDILKSFVQAPKYKYGEVQCTELLMRSEKSYLQQVLLRANPNSNVIPLPADWDPHRCDFPYQVFVSHVRLYFQTKGIGKLEVGANLLKLRYVEYMSQMRDVNQFVRGILITYGPNVTKYPVRALQLIAKQELLKPNSVLLHVIQKLPKCDSCAYFQIHGTGASPKNPRFIVPTYISSSSPTSIMSTLPAQSSKASSVYSDISRSESLVSLQSISSSIRSSNKPIAPPKTISPEEFFKCTLSLWETFYGKQNNSPPPQTWYDRYKGQFPTPNNQGGILDSVIDILLQDSQSLRNFSMYEIPRICDVPMDTYQDVESNLDVLISKQYSKGFKGNGAWYEIMETKKSTLQAALVQSKVHVPSNISAWAPSQCVFPFPAFKAHLMWHLQQNGMADYITAMDLKVVKVRYVEYLSCVMFNLNAKRPANMILGIFSAYGPNILEYPFRVLQIMKQRELIRTDSVLYQVVDKFGRISNEYYCDIYESMAVFYSSYPSLQPLKSLKEVQRTPKPSSNAVAPQDISRKSDGTNSCTVTVNGSDTQNSEVVLAHNAYTFATWKEECDKALNNLSQNVCSKLLEIPPEAYKEAFVSYQQMTENPSRKTVLQSFILGLHTGTQLKGLTPQGTVSASSECASAISSLNLHLDKNEIKIMQELGVNLSLASDTLHQNFVAGKRLELETVDEIVHTHKGEGVSKIVNELAFRICCLKDDENIKITALLIEELVALKHITRAFVIETLKCGVILHLHELRVRVLDVIPRLGSFLVHLFGAQEDFCWFFIMTQDLRINFLPVWKELCAETLKIYGTRKSKEHVIKILVGTPRSNDILADVSWK